MTLDQLKSSRSNHFCESEAASPRYIGEKTLRNRGELGRCRGTRCVDVGEGQSIPLTTLGEAKSLEAAAYALAPSRAAWIASARPRASIPPGATASRRRPSCSVPGTTAPGGTRATARPSRFVDELRHLCQYRLQLVSVFTILLQPTEQRKAAHGNTVPLIRSSRRAPEPTSRRSRRFHPEPTPPPIPN